MRIRISSGVGEGPTPLAAFDAALENAGVSNYNLLCLSSIIPPGSVVERVPYQPTCDEFGYRLYVVLAHQRETVPGKSAWAGLGWVQNPQDGRGLFVEIQGDDRTDVERRIEWTLADMTRHRSWPFGPIQKEVVGITCRGRPVCAVVVAVYESQGWQN